MCPCVALGCLLVAHILMLTGMLQCWYPICLLLLMFFFPRYLYCKHNLNKVSAKEVADQAKFFQEVRDAMTVVGFDEEVGVLFVSYIWSICLRVLYVSICLGVLSVSICLRVLYVSICLGVLYVSICLGVLYVSICLGVLYVSICLGVLYVSICLGVLYVSICLGVLYVSQSGACMCRLLETFHGLCPVLHLASLPLPCGHYD